MIPSLTWSRDQFSFGPLQTYRLLWEGRPTNVVMESDGALYRDAMPCDIEQVNHPDFLRQVREWTMDDNIPTEEIPPLPTDSPMSPPVPMDAPQADSPSTDSLMQVDDATVHGAQSMSNSIREDEFSRIIGGSASSMLQDLERERKRERSKERLRRIGIIAVSSFIVIVIVLVGLNLLGVVSWGDRSRGEGDLPVNKVQRIDYRTPTSESMSPFQQGNIKKDALPGITGKVNWRQRIASDISVSAFDAGIVTINDENLMTFYDPSTGKPYGQLKAPDDLSYLNETTVGGGIPALSWRSGNNLYVWSTEDRKKGPLAIGLTSSSRISLSGSELMIIEGDQAKAVRGGKLVDIKTPESQNILANEGDSVITGTWEGPIHRIDPSTGKVQDSIPLTPPEPGMVVERWISTGRGISIVAWRKPGENPAPDSPVTITFISLADGKILNSIGDKLANIQDISWDRGQGSQLAGFGNRLINMQTGEVVYDGVKEEMTFSYIAGNYALGTQGNDSFLIRDGKKVEADFIPTGVLNDGSVIARISAMEFLSLEGS